MIEHTNRLLILVKLLHPKPACAANVLQAFTDNFNSIAEPILQSLIKTQGRDMTTQKKLFEQTGLAV